MPAEARAIHAALVTGAGGFIGGHLVERLAGSGVTVRALVRDTTRAQPLRAAGAELVTGDITVPGSLVGAFDGIDTVFHCAARVTRNERPHTDFEDCNVHGTRHVLDACRAERVARVVHVSSVAVAEDRPASSYCVTKRAAEDVALAAHRTGLSVVIARPMWVYGWRSAGVVKLFRLIARGRMLLIGGARNSTQPIAVDDLVDALLRCATAPGIEGRRFDLAGPVPITTGELCRDIAAALGVPPPRWNLPLPLAEFAAGLCERLYPRALGLPPITREKLAFFQTEHAYALATEREQLGWQPRTPFDAGARQVARELRAHGLLA